MPKLLRILATHSGQLANYSSMGASLGIGHATIQKYTDVLARLFMIRALQPWYTNELKRLVKTPKLHFLDSALLAALRNLSPARLASDRMVYGALLETFVFAELLKLSTRHEERIDFFHFRDRYNNEVDIVIEDPRGHVVGIGSDYRCNDTDRHQIKLDQTVATVSELNGSRSPLCCGQPDRTGPSARPAHTVVYLSEGSLGTPSGNPFAARGICI